MRGRSLGPTFRADFRKSLLQTDATDGMVLDGDSFGTGGGSERVPFVFCLTGLGCFGLFTDGLRVFDFSDRVLLTTELDLELDDDFDIELSLDLDGDGVLSLLTEVSFLLRFALCDVLLFEGDELLHLFIRENPFDENFDSM